MPRRSPARLRWRSARVPAQQIGAPYRSGIAEALKALHEHRILLQCGRRVDQGAEQLVVPGGRDAELLTDGLLLLPAVLPRSALEREHREVPGAELGRP